MFIRPRSTIAIIGLILLSIVTVACHSQTKGKTELLEPYKHGKIAIFSPTNHISEPLFNCISTLQQNNSIIRHETFPDDFIKQENQYLAKGMLLAYDTHVRYLIVVPAIPGTTKLFESLHRIKPELILIALFPMEDPVQLEKVSTAVYYVELPESCSYTSFEESVCHLTNELIHYLIDPQSNKEHHFTMNGIYKLVIEPKER